MRDYSLTVEQPWWLLLLLLVPLLWWTSRRSLAGLGTWRRWVALSLRSLLVLLLTLALADAQLVRTSNRTAVFYLVDRSLSVPAGDTPKLIAYVNASIRTHRDTSREDQAGVIVFGADAAIEAPPTTTALQLPERFETPIDGDATNLAAALRLVRAAFPEHAACRIVILSDGRQTEGDALEEARTLTEAGVGIDVVPLARRPMPDVLVEKITLPADVRRGTPFEVRVVVTRSGGEAAPIAGRLFVSRTAGEHVELLADEAVTLPAGKQVFTFREQIETADYYTYEARFVPADAAADSQPRNNTATAFTHIRGRGKVLFIEDWAKAGQFDRVVEQLRVAGLEVSVQPTNQLFTNLAELQRYDAVVLADVPRVSGDDANRITLFSDEQVAMLAQNTQRLGAGLVMLGGPDSFGAGGWANSPLEQAMPVDFQVKNAKVVPVSALMLVIDRSGSMSGEKLAMCQAAAKAAVRVLGEKDYVGVVAFDSAAQVVVPMQQVKSLDKIDHLISQLDSGGGTNMRPGMDEGYRALRKVTASVKHMIVLTDGQTEGDGYESLSASMRKRGITTTTVAVGVDSAAPLLRRVANAGTGKFYAVKQARAIPRIFMKEAMRVARPLVFEDEAGFTPQVVGDHEALSGISGALPPITGMVLTTPKENSLVELPIVSPKPVGLTNAVLATWQYGLGRSAAFTTDAGQRWSSAWNDWEGQDRLFVQLVRWAMRPTEETGRFNLFTDVRDGRVQVVVSALDRDDRYVNFLDLAGTAVGPSSNAIDLRLAQMAPGRYVGEFAADQPGAYFLSVSPGAGQPPILAGVNVPYSAEFRDQASNEPLLHSLAALAPRGGDAGAVIDDPTGGRDLNESLRVNVFRGGLNRAPDWHDAWYVLLVFFGGLFLLDVFNRRVLVSLAWIGPAARRLWQRLLQRELAPVPTQSIARLQARKAEVDRELGARAASARFIAPAANHAIMEPPAGQQAPVDRPPVSPPVQESGMPATLAPEQETSEGSYTSRLLRAKQQVWKERGE